MKISQLSELAQVASNADYLPILDVSDTSQSSLGSTRKIPFEYFSNGTLILRPLQSLDDVVINAALNTINTYGGGRLYLKGYREDYYEIGSRIQAYNNTTIFGDGIDNTILKKKAGVSNARLFTNQDDVNGNSNIHVHDLTFNGNHEAGDTGIMFNMAHVTNGLVERVKTINGMQGFKSDTCTDLTYRDCIADGNYNWNFYAFAGTRVKFYNNKSLNAKADTNEGFGMAFYQNNVNGEAVGNYIFNSAGNALQVNSGSATADVIGMVLRDNVVVGSNNRGIMITDDNHSFHVKKISVVNNRVTGSISAGIYLIHATDGDIVGNKSYNNSGDGIIYENCTNIYSEGNLSTANLTGLRIVGTASGVTSFNDFIYSNAGNYSPSIGATGVKIRNNATYVTQNSGIATINSGSTSIVVSHGLTETPVLKNISVTLGKNPTNDCGNIWIDTITSTQFTINVRNDPGVSNLDLSWRAVIL